MRMFAAGYVIDAEKWCSFALRMIAQLERFKESYENHVSQNMHFSISTLKKEQKD